MATYPTLPSQEADIIAIWIAILDAARANQGEVTAATIRAHLTREVEPHMIGAVVSKMTGPTARCPGRHLYLKRIPGRFEYSGNGRSRNSQRMMPVYILVDDSMPGFVSKLLPKGALV
jgi:hypothetical protein